MFDQIEKSRQIGMGQAAVPYVEPTLRERLVSRYDHLQKELDKINTLISMLDTNPEAGKMLEALHDVRHML